MSAHTTKTLRCSNCTKPVHEVPVDYDLGDPVACGARCSASLAIADHFDPSERIEEIRAEALLIMRQVENGEAPEDDSRTDLRALAAELGSYDEHLDARYVADTIRDWIDDRNLAEARRHAERVCHEAVADWCEGGAL